MPFISMAPENGVLFCRDCHATNHAAEAQTKLHDTFHPEKVLEPLLGDTHLMIWFARLQCNWSQNRTAFFGAIERLM